MIVRLQLDLTSSSSTLRTHDGKTGKRAEREKGFSDPLPLDVGVTYPVRCQRRKRKVNFVVRERICDTYEDHPWLFRLELSPEERLHEEDAPPEIHLLQDEPWKILNDMKQPVKPVEPNGRAIVL